MFGTSRIRHAAMAAMAAAALAAVLTLVFAQHEATARDAVRRLPHVPEVLSALSQLSVEKPRTYKNMVVFPIRWSGKQAPGRWETLDEAVSAGHLKISEKDQARVPAVTVENTGDLSVFLMSGEIIKGGKQTRVMKKDTVIEPRQTVTVPVLCIEQGRWAGDNKFRSSANAAPARLRDSLNRGSGQGEVWNQVREARKAAGAESATEDLDAVLDSDKVKKEHTEAHKALGNFSPPDTIGIAVADTRTGRVIGLELFGRRDLFASLQDKLIEGYTTDLVIVSATEGRDRGAKITVKDVEAFIGKVFQGNSRYEDTPGSGRGIDLTSGTIKGKGAAVGGHAIHLSIQDQRPPIRPAKPIIDP